jgi:hypothetical protein
MSGKYLRLPIELAGHAGNFIISSCDHSESEAPIDVAAASIALDRSMRGKTPPAVPAGLKVVSNFENLVLGAMVAMPVVVAIIVFDQILDLFD